MQGFDIVDTDFNLIFHQVNSGWIKEMAVS
ncbi:Uncharacterised protein [Vibrio cholerae]|nr:Uncharacterised protein [Vibrio cholerae]